MVRLKHFYAFILFPILIAACEQPRLFAPKSIVLEVEDTLTAPVPLVPPSDKLDTNCMTNESFDACIFLKNPVAQIGSALTGDNDRSGAASAQMFGIKIVGVNRSGFLENSTIRIITRNGTRLPIVDRIRLKTSAADDSRNDLEQVMTYYYLNQAVSYWRGRGPLAIVGANLSVMVDDSVAGFSSRDNSIHLLKRDGRLPMAFDASQAIYYLGMANFHRATKGAINSLTSDSNHRLCGSDPHGCCASEKGCARALVAGAATYFTAVLFPDKPIIAEMAQNRIAGFQICGRWNSNLLEHGNDTAASAFNLCPDQLGNVHAMGLVYASVLWQVRQQAGVDSAEMDRLYLLHLKTLNSSDTLSTAREKLIDIDQKTFAGRHVPLLVSESSRRGIF